MTTRFAIPGPSGTRRSHNFAFIGDRSSSSKVDLQDACLGTNEQELAASVRIWRLASECGCKASFYR